MDLNIPFLVLTGSEDPINDKGKQAQEISNLLLIVVLNQNLSHMRE